MGQKIISRVPGNRVLGSAKASCGCVVGKPEVNLCLRHSPRKTRGGAKIASLAVSFFPGGLDYL
jgi:hypothetical protein